MRALWGFFWPIGLGCLVAAAIMKWVVSFAIVPTESMYPNIPNPCYIFVDHLATEFSSIHEGEVVLFHYPDQPSEIYVKRVIGLPGDTIRIYGGHVYVNNKKLNEPYLGTLVTEGNWGPYHVPAGHYFMLGDNRNISEDSRFWNHKYVARSAIIGRAEFVIWPLAKVRSIPQ